MKASFSRTVFGEPDKITSLGQLRERLLKVLLISTVVLGAALYAISLIPVFTNGLTGISIVYTILYAWLLVLLFVRRIPYLIRTGSWVTILYAFGIIYLVLHGLTIHAGLLFLAFVTMTTVLVGLRFGLAALLLSSVTITVIGVFTVNGIIKPEVELLQVVPLHWIAGGIILLLMGILLSVPLAALVSSLDVGLIKAISLAGKLEQANASILANEDRFRAMIENSADIISILSIDGTVQYISPSVERILGYKIEELIGRKIFDFLHPDDINIVVAALTPGTPAEEIGPSLELRLRHKDGSWRILEVGGKKCTPTPRCMAQSSTVVILLNAEKTKKRYWILVNCLQWYFQALAMWYLFSMPKQQSSRTVILQPQIFSATAGRKCSVKPPLFYITIPAHAKNFEGIYFQP